jgi:hypothetical protein
VSNPIPEESRRIVEWRDRNRCVRCGGAGSEWHHRRGRSVKDRHQHCACNGILLCRTCHAYAHAYPTIAQNFGFVVSRHCEDPSLVPVKNATGWAVLTCEGDAYWTASDRVVIDEGVPMLRVDL